MALVTYLVDNIRVTPPSDKTKEKNPDRLWTVSGVFHSTDEVDGKLVRKDKLTIPSKNITREMARVPGFRIDRANGILTMPEGERGRKAFESLSQDEIDAELLALQAEDDSEETGEETGEETATN